MGKSSFLCGAFDCWLRGRQNGDYTRVDPDGSPEQKAGCAAVGDSFCEIRCHSLAATDSNITTPAIAPVTLDSITTTPAAAAIAPVPVTSPGAEEFLARLNASSIMIDVSDTDESLSSPVGIAQLLPSPDAEKQVKEQVTPEQQVKERSIRRKRALTEVLQSGAGGVFRDMTNAPAALSPARRDSASKIGNRLVRRSPAPSPLRMREIDLRTRE